ncbi:hypothetical protein [Anaerocolumna jejuensis]|uniref:hypothetical protein n=1 Tax=Anaerocolumna jejuensis TaxID=259063 RepID=UPI003F7C69D4
MTDDFKSSMKRGDILTNTKLLRNLIIDKGLKMKFVADYLGLSAYGFQLKLENKQEFKASEVSALCDLLGIKSLKEKEDIFFVKQMI